MYILVQHNEKYNCYFTGFEFGFANFSFVKSEAKRYKTKKSAKNDAKWLRAVEIEEVDT